jgi:IQ domain-containing protein H|tara:strand:+ start:2538 stop:2819 length:282 start_codon:yes stop_codon:yes gene_type:complete
MADVPVPIGAHDIYNYDEFCEQLTKLISHSLYINTWIFKIDDEFNGRGHASLNVESIKTIMELRKKKVEMTDTIIKKLEEVIKKVLPKKVQIA